MNIDRQIKEFGIERTLIEIIGYVSRVSKGEEYLKTLVADLEAALVRYQSRYDADAKQKKKK